MVLDEEQFESKNSRSSFSGSLNKSGSSKKSDGEDSEKEIRKASFKFKRHDSGDFDVVDGLADQILKEKNDLPWPETTLKRIFFIIFFPTHVIFWLCFPNIRRKPEMSKVIITCIFTCIVTIFIVFGIMQLEVYIARALNLKLHILGLINGILFGIM